jgi:hypothetical protein
MYTKFDGEMHVLSSALLDSGAGAGVVLLYGRVLPAVQRHRVHTQAAATETATQELSYVTGRLICSSSSGTGCCVWSARDGHMVESLVCSADTCRVKCLMQDATFDDSTAAVVPSLSPESIPLVYAHLLVLKPSINRQPLLCNCSYCRW